jgi:hypothetical protein
MHVQAYYGLVESGKVILREKLTRVWVFLQGVLFGPKDVLKEKYDIRRDGGGYAGADALELVRPLSSIFLGDYLICGAPK